MKLCAGCYSKPVKWNPKYNQDEPQFCTMECAALWAHFMATGDDLATEAPNGWEMREAGEPDDEPAGL